MARTDGSRPQLAAKATGAGLPFGPAAALRQPAATYEHASDEHGRLAVSAATNRLALGDKIRLIPGHCDPTVNLYDWYVCIRNNRVEQLWPITTRTQPRPRVAIPYDRMSRSCVPRTIPSRQAWAIIRRSNGSLW
jgi:hypothetical protein